MYSIQKTADLLQISKHTLRYYDKIGIMIPKKHENGYRYYEEQDIILLKYIGVLKFIGCSLKEIEELMSLMYKPYSVACQQQIFTFLHEKKKDITSTIAHLQQIILLLSAAEQHIGTQNNELDHLIDQTFQNINKKEE